MSGQGSTLLEDENPSDTYRMMDPGNAPRVLRLCLRGCLRFTIHVHTDTPTNLKAEIAESWKMRQLRARPKAASRWWQQDSWGSKHCPVRMMLPPSNLSAGKKPCEWLGIREPSRMHGSHGTWCLDPTCPGPCRSAYLGCHRRKMP